MRDKHIHHCFSVNYILFWDIIEYYIPKFKNQISQKILKLLILL